MPESTLSISFTDLQVEVGVFLGYDPDPDNWSANETAEVGRYIQSGVRQFYYPPAAEGVEAGYEWSFMRPQGSVTTVVDQDTSVLPDDFGRLLGALHYPSTSYHSPIPIVSQHLILSRQTGSSQAGMPQIACVRFKTQTEGEGQRQELLFWPTPNAAYELAFIYEAFSGKLSTDNPYPLGGMKHSELVVESCLAVAEQRANDERGIHTENFIRMVATAIAQDRKNGPKHFVPTGENPFTVGRSCQQNYPITYKGDTW